MRKTRAGKSNDNIYSFWKSSGFKYFLSNPNRNAGVFKFLRFEDRFRKARQFSVWIRVDGKPNRRSKAAFSNPSGVMCTGHKKSSKTCYALHSYCTAFKEKSIVDLPVKLIYQVLTLSIPRSIPEHVESAVLSQNLQRFDSESEEQMSDDAPSTLKRTSTERRSIIQRYRKLMRRESRDFPNNTDENGENSLIRVSGNDGRCKETFDIFTSLLPHFSDNVMIHLESYNCAVWLTRKLNNCNPPIESSLDLTSLTFII